MSFLHDAWYMAAWAAEVTTRPMKRTLLNQRVVLFRTLSGKLTGLADRCPHRFAPLSMGKVIDDGIECAYHGLQFDVSGACVRNQMGSGRIPSSVKVRAYPLIQRHQMVWIWMGDPQRADAAAIPDYGEIIPETKQGADNIGNYLHVKANYLLEIDNLMDLSHVNFLHCGTLGNESMRTTQPQVTETGDKIRADLWMPNTLASFGELAGGPCDQWQNMVWMHPTSMLLEFGQVPPGAPRVQKPDELAVHIVTPETERTTHYFFGTSANYAQSDAWKAEAMRGAQRAAFINEDNPMIEAIDEQMGDADFWSLEPVLLRGDSAAVRVRRRLDGLIKEEQARTAPASRPPA